MNEYLNCVLGEDMRGRVGESTSSNSSSNISRQEEQAADTWRKRENKIYDFSNILRSTFCFGKKRQSNQSIKIS